MALSHRELAESPPFKQLIVLSLMDSEGGATKNLDGDGCWTVCGIHQKHSRHWPGWKRWNPDVKDRHFPLNTLMKTEFAPLIVDFYLEYIREDCADFVGVSMSLCFMLSHASVLCGKPRARKILQATFNQCLEFVDEHDRLSRDGIIGGQTLRAAEHINLNGLNCLAFAVYCSEFHLYLTRVCRARPEKRKFFRGWSRRISRAVAQTQIPMRSAISVLSTALDIQTNDGQITY